jgi:hypothetical protein
MYLFLSRLPFTIYILRTFQNYTKHLKTNLVTNYLCPIIIYYEYKIKQKIKIPEAEKKT